jgi:hypothetical protein
MADIIIRNLEPVVLQKIDELAKKKKISREEYLRRYLTKVSELEDVVQLDEKYSNLISALSERMEQANDVIEINTMFLQRMEDYLKNLQ